MCKKKFVFLICLALLCLTFCGCQSSQSSPISKSGVYLDTVITVTLYGTEEESILDHCLSLCESYEALFSRTMEGSDVYRMNHAGGQPTQVSPETARLIEKAISYSNISDGAFDCTIAPLSTLWDFKNNPGRVPSQEEIEAARSLVDYRTIQASQTTVTLKNPSAAIDLGGIAKGYIADRLKDYLTSQGITSALINLGGNVLTIGSKPDGSPWNIGIQKPFDERNASIASLKVTDQSLVTSGTYERYFTVGGTVYHHLLDPATGYPADTGLSSVTILSDDSIDGDALSTSCFVLGIDKGMELIESLPGVEALFVTSEDELLYSSGLE